MCDRWTHLLLAVLASACGAPSASPSVVAAPLDEPHVDEPHVDEPHVDEPRVDEPDAALAAATRLSRRRALVDLAGMPLEAREEAIFGALYNELDHPKPRALTQEAYTARLGVRVERVRDTDPWHVRWGAEGTADLGAETVRFYMNVVPEHAATLADELTADLDRRAVRRYSFKVLRSLALFDVPVAAVLYVEGADLEAGQAAALAFAQAHPDALWPEEPPFTRRLAPGLAVADEIGDRGPPGVAGNSFGGAMAHLLALALEAAPTDLDPSALAERMRAQLERAGFDPAAPWRRPAAAGEHPR